ncbi:MULTISPECIES: MspA family porin [Rhodococcus]|uniref:Porin protein MspA n=1 Tax=Rhodococcus pyridinivorans AK37 TaxID=1114960 RepID=H0JVZ4_9NOCA|nr:MULTISPECIES: MspA family porin [Rhodococcus]APE08057.1 porin [Rhodococcus sp. 2G]AWZ24098.1 porin [Rhodococcus pyridinivorans]EHK81545.1 porin protein MspA [Rhodococcus pyridinivorans AK37]MCD2117918.1 MspA family porin [Rhodococcus pyridinivorans]MCD2142718.1 MspA family porin [Rhodococcus pyridinivorans]
MGIKSRGFKAARNATVAGAAVLGLVLGASGAASAEVNDQNRIVSDGLEVVVTQEDTFIQGVPALGGSPFNREFFHNGRGTANLLGEGAADAEGTTFQFGYQFAWAGSIDGAIGVTYSTPQLELEISDSVGATVTDILPQAYAELELTPAPGIEELVVAEGEFDGDFKTVQFSNVHGTASGVLGAVQVRPFVRAITANGDNVTTYGAPWTV